MFRKNENFNLFFERENGWNVTDVILLSYSLNPRMLNEILMQTGMAEFYCNSDNEEEFAEHVECRIDSCRYVQDGDIGDFPYANIVLAEGKIKGIQYCNHSYHPKLWLFLMRRVSGTSVEEKIRLIISSRNIAKKNMLEGALCLEGTVGKESDKNAALISFLTKVSKIDESNKIVSLLNKIDFSPSIGKVLGVNPTSKVNYLFDYPKSCTCKDLVELMKEDADNSEQAIIVSPFLGAHNFLKNYVTDNTRVITNTKISPKALESENTIDKHIYVYQSEESTNKDAEQDDIEEYADLFLHAKIYAFDHDEKSILYIGSSNFSENGFKNNAELVCRIEVEDKSVKFAEKLEEAFRTSIRPMREDDIVTEEPDEEKRIEVGVPQIELTNDDKKKYLQANENGY